MNNFRVGIVLFFVSSLFFITAYSVFFTQDDFILINEFSRGNLLQDIGRVFGQPTVTHWRPVHNLFFMIGGNVFGESFFMFHFTNFVIHTLIGLLIYRILFVSGFSRRNSFFSSVLYVSNSSHFFTLAWISGSATSIGFVLFLTSFYFYLKNNLKYSAIFYITSIMASEAFVVGLPIFIFHCFLSGKLSIRNNFLRFTAMSTFVFIFIKFFFLTSKDTLDAYRLSLSFDTLKATYFYFFRIIGFTQGFSKEYFSFLLVLIFGFVVFKRRQFIKISVSSNKNIIFYIFVTFIGLFPFVLIPNHLSAHYMNISIWGFSVLLATLISTKNKYISSILLGLMLFNYFLQIAIIEKNNWLLPRSKIAKEYIDSIENNPAPGGATLVFDDNAISSSYEAYISLGTGKALDFWFKNQNYKYCFTWFEDCNNSK